LDINGHYVGCVRWFHVVSWLQQRVSNDISQWWGDHDWHAIRAKHEEAMREVEAIAQEKGQH